MHAHQRCDTSYLVGRADAGEQGAQQPQLRPSHCLGHCLRLWEGVPCRQAMLTAMTSNTNYSRVIAGPCRCNLPSPHLTRRPALSHDGGLLQRHHLAKLEECARPSVVSPGSAGWAWAAEDRAAAQGAGRGPPGAPLKTSRAACKGSLPRPQGPRQASWLLRQLRRCATSSTPSPAPSGGSGYCEVMFGQAFLLPSAEEMHGWQWHMSEAGLPQLLNA